MPLGRSPVGSTHTRHCIHMEDLLHGKLLVFVCLSPQ